MAPYRTLFELLVQKPLQNSCNRLPINKKVYIRAYFLLTGDILKIEKSLSR
jgi:hypothetical protein